ncbi:hypothetical protein [Novosphingobium sp.]|uniref:hypothetical protein n=1 Tax=Novosphingobium sp. TaxID=1874826 RepID=UPI0025E5FF85|nr:hypothetical protein [Novosphingobium sp.]
MARLTIGLTAAVLLSAAPAYAASSAWKAGMLQGIIYYGAIGQRGAGDRLSFECNATGATITSELRGSPAKGLVHVTVDGTKTMFSPDEDGAITTDTPIERDNFRWLWGKVRSGKVLTLRYDDGRTGTFSLRGAARVLPSKPCMTEYR